MDFLPMLLEITGNVDIRANMILTAALIEGVALFGVVVGLLTLVL